MARADGWMSIGDALRRGAEVRREREAAEEVESILGSDKESWPEMKGASLDIFAYDKLNLARGPAETDDKFRRRIHAMLRRTPVSV